MSDKSLEALPPWDPDMSDGCTDSPDSGWWGVHLECCLFHDESYYYGGSKKERARVDRDFYDCLIAHNMPRLIAMTYYRAVRIGGHPRFKRKGASWGFGGEVFEYSGE